MWRPTDPEPLSASIWLVVPCLLGHGRRGFALEGLAGRCGHEAARRGRMGPWVRDESGREICQISPSPMTLGAWAIASPPVFGEILSRLHATRSISRTVARRAQMPGKVLRAADSAQRRATAAAVARWHGGRMGRRRLSRRRRVRGRLRAALRALQRGGGAATTGANDPKGVAGAWCEALDRPCHISPTDFLC